MSNIRLSLILTAGIALATSATAQELKENIHVEGSYTPEIIRQERLNSFPKAPDFSPEGIRLPYDTKARILDYQPVLTPMQATEWGATRDSYSYKGYLKAGLGSYLNSDLSAGFRPVNNNKSIFGASVQFNSSSLYHNDAPGEKDLLRRRYNGEINLYASHRFTDLGLLSASASYGFGYFNYFASVSEGVPLSAPWQATNQANFKISWDDLTPSSLNWHTGISVSFLGYRDFYLPNKSPFLEPLRLPGQRETDINLTGSLTIPWESGARIGLNAAFDLLLYSEPGKSASATALSALPHVDDYANLLLNPHYGFQRGLLNVLIGADIDLTFRAGYEGSRYHLFHIAPDIRFDWRKKRAAFFLHIIGGSELQTLGRLRENDYCAMPLLTNTRPVFSPANATLGFSCGPFSGFTASITGAFKISNHTRLGGWYQYLLANNVYPDGELINAYQPGCWLNPDNDLSLKGWSFGLNLEYKYASLLEASLKGTYQHQRNGHGYFNGYDRPRYTLDAALKGRPMAALSLELAWKLRALRSFYYRNFDVPEPGKASAVVATPTTTLSAFNVPNLSELSFKAEFECSKGFSVWAQADNLLCRKNVLLPGVISEKLSVMGGFSLLF